MLVWLHGGALIMGNKKGVPGDLLELCRKEGYCLVSPNYRLAPQAKLPQIREDLQDFWKWLHEKGPALFHADARRIVVAGGSAGGYLTMMSGLLEPRPNALVAYYGYGDVDGPWYTTPSEFYRKQPLISNEDAYKGMPPDVVAEPAPGGFNRGRLYLYFRQNGLWTKEVSGFDPATEKSKLDPYCPVRNITAQYPPIVMLHGTADTDVPCQESLDMVAPLQKNHVHYEMFAINGAGHGLMGGDRPMVDKAMARAREFIKENLGAGPAGATPASSQPAATSRAEVFQAWPFGAAEAARRQEETAKSLGIAKELTLDLAEKVPMKFVLIPAGKFMMGRANATWKSPTSSTCNTGTARPASIMKCPNMKLR